MNYSLFIFPHLLNSFLFFKIYFIFFIFQFPYRIILCITGYSQFILFPLFNLLNYIYIFFIFLPNPLFSLNFLISLLFICTTLYHYLRSILNLFFNFIIQIFYLPSSTIYKNHNNLDTLLSILLNNSTTTTIF